MARTHERTETWEIPADRDHWDVIRAVDAYLRLRIGLDKRCWANVHDVRGTLRGDTLHKCYEEWQEESSPLNTVIVRYGDTLDDGLTGYLQAYALDAEPSGEQAVKPTLKVQVTGADAAEVTGVAQEAIHKAEQGVVLPKMEVPKIELQPVQWLPAGERPAGSGNPFKELSGEPSKVSRIMNHPWVVGIGVTAIGTVLATLVMLWMTR